MNSDDDEEHVTVVPVIGDVNGQAARWRNYRTRCFWGIVMIVLFTMLLLAGHFPIVLMVIGIQIAIFKEVIGIAHVRYRERKLPWFRTINW
jgi:phosphatidate cytidylyltransferase